MRLFVALLPPRPVRDELARALAPHREHWPQLRWADPDNWHLTLAFLGEVAEELLPALQTRLARAASRYEPMTLAFAGAGAFPSARRARVFWAGLRGGETPQGGGGPYGGAPHEDGGSYGGAGPHGDGGPHGGRPGIVRLADSVGAAARREGIAVDERRFRPHLTLARAKIRGDVDLRPLVGALEPFAGSAWEADTVHLMRSHLGGRVRYETVERWPLVARASRGQD
ncbi:RNA 2',3'-cyclic phosphodiesterase [Planomonospora parontospora subsp. parontospora]|uniref:RNA 2',3'-cyclic phosphodiesterase n=2 Tax=Planomonospora parontospora TaxID=58119 RepID=A0AA37BHS0_9ACTN|nr:RNA 2',3'-cyclic phosphodiesterase [Planomonospora parontospora]GGK71065.1 RNA 2',3'-cyclic phosphodiesterase [Planomonospora parontospora]GII09718.1 RNA 2',3'-cyclic phosphodiesterase [Planomonospora parontospora subsp. parontospora]